MGMHTIDEIEDSEIKEKEAVEVEPHAVEPAQTIDPLELTQPKEQAQEVKAAEVIPEKITVNDFRELYKTLPKEKKTEFMAYTQGVDLNALSEEELAGFYKEVKEHVGA